MIMDLKDSVGNMAHVGLVLRGTPTPARCGGLALADHRAPSGYLTPLPPPGAGVRGSMPPPPAAVNAGAGWSARRQTIRIKDDVFE
ncbi:hypothetical protein JOQ06_021246, partial [Pogonophryne albipinna]